MYPGFPRRGHVMDVARGNAFRVNMTIIIIYANAISFALRNT